MNSFCSFQLSFALSVHVIVIGSTERCALVCSTRNAFPQASPVLMYLLSCEEYLFFPAKFCAIQWIEPDSRGTHGFKPSSSSQCPHSLLRQVSKLKTENFKPKEQVTLEPYERDHAVVIALYRPPKKKSKDT